MYMSSWAGFHNHLIRLKFNPKCFMKTENRIMSFDDDNDDTDGVNTSTSR